MTYAAAGIAKADPIDAAWIACRLGIVIYILPFIFVYDPSILGMGDWWEVALTVVRAFPSCALFAVAIQGHLLGRLSGVERLLAAAIAGALIFPSHAVAAVGAAALVVAMSFYIFRHQRTQQAIPKSNNGHEVSLHSNTNVETDR